MKGCATISTEYILQALRDTQKKIDGLKGFHIPVVQQTIADYEKAGVDGHFIEQQRLQLQKLFDMLSELEAKAERLKMKI